MSALAWIDFDEAERSRMQQLIALFQEQETRDELGLGSVRDFISDQLFPGTSTIQTRLRYMLFVPWILRSLESRNATSEQFREEGRRLELRLISALRKGLEQAGVIGATVGDSLQRLPSSIYWPGLAHWGIRRFEGSLESYFESLVFLRERRGGQQREDNSSMTFWHAALPAAPPGYLDECSFRLTAEEAQFIIDRLVATHPDCLLTWLARNGDAGMADAIWMHPSFDTFTAPHRALVGHAQQFSDVMHGAALVYNLLLGERRPESPLRETYLQALAAWAEGLDLAAVRAWQPEELFTQMAQAGVAARPPLREFVFAWKRAVEAGPGGVGGDSGARQLVERRERQMKGNQSRFANSARLSAWNGASGTQPLSYRWHRAQSHLQDLADAR
jgi:hypothetical protein